MNANLRKTWAGVVSLVLSWPPIEKNTPTDSAILAESESAGVEANQPTKAGERFYSCKPGEAEVSK